MKRILACSLAACFALAFMGGCATSQERVQPESSEGASAEHQVIEPDPIEIIESGWSADEHGYIYYGIGLKNPNSSFEAQSVTVTITGKDDQGKIVFADNQVMSFILPGGEYYFGSQAGNGTAPQTVEFSVSVKDSGWVENDRQSFAAYDVANINEVVSEYGDTSFTGELTANADWSDVNSAWVSVILRDASGSIIYGTNTFADISEEGQTVPFEIHAYEPPEHATYELIAVPWF